VDLIGPPMNIASKIQNLAKPNQILIGIDVFIKLHPDLQKEFTQIIWKNTKWEYRSRLTGEIYEVYEHKE
jgi:class 3 adenylate cyclase